MAEGENEDISSLSDQCVRLLHLILLDDFRDDCNCACCAGGCFAFKKLLEALFGLAKPNNKHFFGTPGSPVSLSKVYRPPLSAIFYTIDKTLAAKKRQGFYDTLAPRVLRYLTFYELDLTHTCCHERGEMNSQRVREIQEEEACLITQLDSLVDELLDQYRSSSLTLHQFLKDV
ncbi:hypothetical protein BJY04DRAFT_222440 [Aspergillus karnatakaensis]|uniref:uncharacterized protein n=1 Tax=Aspergillus karnatakaensis TaxID=1810916 RepID=UPI003CCD69FF